MFYGINVGLVWIFFILIHNIMETSTIPVGLQVLSSSDSGYQIVNTTNLLAYQGSDLVGNPILTRNKRWLDELYSYFYDSSEEDSSSEEEEDKSKRQKDKGHALCHNCTVTYNQVSQVQHINRVESQTNQPSPGTMATVIDTTTTPRSELETTVANSPSTEGTAVYETTNPNKIETTNKQQETPITQESTEAAATTTETPKEESTSTTAGENIDSATTTVATEAAMAVTPEATTTLEPAAAEVITEAPIMDTAETMDTAEAMEAAA